MKKRRILLTLFISSTFFSSINAFANYQTMESDIQAKSVEQVPINLVNGDFEEPSIGGIQLVDQAVVPGWNTTASDKKIEVWERNNSYNIPSYSGNQFVELMANMKSALYQDIDTKPGSYVYWRVAHRGRSGVDVAEVKFGKPGENLVTQKVLRTGNDSWKEYSGYYKIPVGQTKTRFQFEGISTASGSDSVGNFLDGIKFTSEYRGSNIIVEYKDIEGNQLATSDSYKGPVGESYSVIPKDIPGYTLVKTEGNPNGIYTDQDQKVTFIYEPVKGAPVTVKYVDENGEELISSEILAGEKIGSAYHTQPKQILGCQLIETPSNANGVFQAHSQEVVYRYRRIITLTAPTSIFWGTHQIMRGNQEYPVEKIVGEPLQIIDGRKKGSKWQLYAKLQQPLINSSGKILSSGLSYQVDNEKKDITTNAYQIIQSHTTTKDREQTNISNNWNNTQGLFLKVNEGEAQVGTYQGVIEWLLNDAPTN